MISPVDAPAAATADAAALAALLQRLQRDGEPGAAYEALRRRLLRFFRLHAPAQAEELADIALDRLARRLDEGVEVARVASYVLGIARLVALEARAKERRHQHAEDGDDWPAEDEASVQERAQDERDAAALSACLEEAGAQARELILDYYGADGARTHPRAPAPGEPARRLAQCAAQPRAAPARAAGSLPARTPAARGGAVMKARTDTQPGIPARTARRLR